MGSTFAAAARGSGGGTAVARGSRWLGWLGRWLGWLGRWDRWLGWLGRWGRGLGWLGRRCRWLGCRGRRCRWLGCRGRWLGCRGRRCRWLGWGRWLGCGGTAPAADLASKASTARGRISKAKMAGARTSDAHAETAQTSDARAETAQTCPSAGALGGLGELGETKAASEAVLQHGESRVEAVEIVRVALSLRYELVEAVIEPVTVSPVAKRTVGRARNPRERASRQIDGYRRRDAVESTNMSAETADEAVDGLTTAVGIAAAPIIAA